MFTIPLKQALIQCTLTHTHTFPPSTSNIILEAILWFSCESERKYAKTLGKHYFTFTLNKQRNLFYCSSPIMLINIILCSSLLILLPFFVITKALSTHFITLHIIIAINIVNRNFLHKNPEKITLHLCTCT